MFVPLSVQQGISYSMNRASFVNEAELEYLVFSPAQTRSIFTVIDDSGNGLETLTDR